MINYTLRLLSEAHRQINVYIRFEQALFSHSTIFNEDKNDTRKIEIKVGLKIVKDLEKQGC